jgi:hypothetical protein
MNPNPTRDEHLMTDLLSDRWSSRDLPFLIEAARKIDAGQQYFPVTTMDTPTGMTPDDRLAATRGLVPSYLTAEPVTAAEVGTFDFFITGLTERGRRAVGLWPSGESVDALVDALRKAEEATDDPEEKSLIRRAAGAVTSVSRDIMVDVMGAVISRQISGG